MPYDFIYKWNLALVGVAQWIEHQPVNKKVAGLSPSKSTCLDCGPGPHWEKEAVQEANLFLKVLCK